MGNEQSNKAKEYLSENLMPDTRSKIINACKL